MDRIGKLRKTRIYDTEKGRPSKKMNETRVYVASNGFVSNDIE